MNSARPGARRGAHRTRHDVAAAFVPSLLAVLAVVALVTSLYVWRGEDDRTQDTNQTLALKDPSAGPSAMSTTSTRPTPPTATASGTPRPSSTKTKTPQPATSDTAKVPVGDLEVVVLNQTRRSGLAGTVADRLRRRGWTVPLTGNFRGSVPATTVYYPPGAEDEAQAAASDLPTAPRIRPRYGGLSTTRLTVVVTDSYPS